MRNFRVIFILFIGSLLLTTSCKKGEDDPFLSLRSRDARITGEWLISDISGSETFTIKYTGTYLGDYTETLVTTHTFSGFIWLQSIKSTTVTADSTFSSTDTDSEYRNERITIDKDGLVTLLFTDEDGNQSSQSGQWYWVDNNKNKIGIVFEFEFGDYSYNIRQLKNKELVLEEKGQSSTNSDYSNSSNEFEILYTYEKQ